MPSFATAIDGMSAMRALKRRLLSVYTYSVAEKLRLDVIGGWAESHFARPGASITDFAAWRGEPPGDAEYLIGTSASGLLLLRGGRVHRLPSGRYVYGIAKGPGGEWYFSESARFHSRIRRISLSGISLLRDEVVYWGLPPRVHQIDCMSDVLYVADTYHNRIVLLDAGQGVKGGYWRRHASCHYPNGSLPAGRSSSNYAHFNSIALRSDGAMAILAHNETAKSGRQSEVLFFDSGMTLISRRETGTSNAHNPYFDSGRNLVACDSGAGVVRHGDRNYRVGPFPRGLSVSEDYVAVGCSPVSKDRDRRDRHGAAELLFVNTSTGACSRLFLENTQVHEIRRVDREDFAMGAQTGRSGIGDALAALERFRSSDAAAAGP